MLGRWGDDPLFAVGRHPRYRARRRSEVRTAAQVVAIIVAAVTALDLITLAPSAPILIPVNLTEIGAVLGAGWLARGRLQRHPEAITLFVGMAAVVATIVPYAFDRSIAYALLAYVALIIVSSALFVPWSASMHAAWVVTCLVLVGIFMVSPLGRQLDVQTQGAGTQDIVAITLASSLVSVAGYVAAERRRLRSLAAELQVRALHERTREQQAELLHLYRELEVVARTDGLTRTGNRLRLHEDEARLVAPAAAGPGRRPVRAAAIVDLDRFKRYNDRYGHLGGDDALRGVAAVLRSLRDADVYRFGGEEFLLVAPFASVEEVGPAIDGLRRAVEELGIAHADNLPWRRLTISIGVDIRETAAPIDLETWIRQADLALYRAKASGRNRTTVVRPNGAEQTWVSKLANEVSRTA